MSTGYSTTRVVEDRKRPRLLRRKVRLEVVRGPGAGRSGVFGTEEINVGSLPESDLVLADSSVSRYHLRIATGHQGYVITDLDSTNGTFIGTLRVREVCVTEAVELRLGDSAVRLTPLSDEEEVPLHPSEELGAMVGRSPQLRALFAQVEPVASSEATVLIEGETGTGKELLAEEIHRRSRRAKGPFVIVDCGAIPDNLMESELFGHKRGSFTGASSDRTGAFELAAKGTLFLDEVGELSISAQPKMLRALDSRTVKPVGSDRYLPLDVRIIAATNRDLRRSVNEGTFRSDLFYRLSVMRLRIPPLRERPEDIELLAHRFMGEAWERLAQGTFPPPLTQETIGRLVSHRWPGNVRELRNFMERVAVMAQTGRSAALGSHAGSAGSGLQPELDPAPAGLRQEDQTASLELRLPYKEAKMQWIDHFEVTYISDLLQRNNGNVAAAAREADVDRTYLFRLIRKYGLRR